MTQNEIKAQPLIVSCSLRAIVDYNTKGEPCSVYVESIEELKRLEELLRIKLGRTVNMFDVMEYVRLEQRH